MPEIGCTELHCKGSHDADQQSGHQGSRQAGQTTNHTGAAAQIQARNQAPPEDPSSIFTITVVDSPILESIRTDS